MIIAQAEYVKGGTKIEEFPTDGKKEFLLCGRSNVGKSSFINMVLERKNLAYTSSKPGKTICLNFFLVNKSFYFVDVPGYGYAVRSKEEIAKFGTMMENYIKNRDNLALVFQLVDFRHPPTKDDITMYNYLKHFNHKVIIIATKADKVKKSMIAKSQKQIVTGLGLPSVNDMILISSVTRDGKKQVHDIITKALEE